MARQTIPLLFAILLPLAAAGVGAPPAFAAAPHYKAEPAAPPAAEKLIVRETVWNCGPAACVARQGNSRPAVECGALARQLGTLRSFAAGGRTFAPEALEKCNARAR
jgi:hypothetical protein